MSSKSNEQSYQKIKLLGCLCCLSEPLSTRAGRELSHQLCCDLRCCVLCGWAGRNRGELLEAVGCRLFLLLCVCAACCSQQGHGLECLSFPFLESQGWKGPTRLSSLTVLLSPSLPTKLLNHILQHLIQTLSMHSHKTSDKRKRQKYSSPFQTCSIKVPPPAK